MLVFSIIVISCIVFLEVLLRIVYFNRLAYEPLALTRACTTIHDRYFIDDIYKKAWDYTYIERGLSVPTSGPREGYYGHPRAGTGYEKNQILGWISDKKSVKDFLEFDENGMQYAGKEAAQYKILIIGASVAAGACASTIKNTYFEKIVQYLEQAGISVRITVFATGAWVSSQELNALLYKGLRTNPDIVIFLDGLNDLVNNINLLKLDEYRRKIPYDERLTDYLENMRIVKDIAIFKKVKLIFALQPSLSLKKQLTPIETNLLKLRICW